MRRWLTTYFYYTRSERNGLLILIALSMLFLCSPFILPFFFPGQHTDFSAFEKEVETFYQQTFSEDEDADMPAGLEEFSFEQENFEPKEKNRQNIEIAALPPPFPFDPNHADEISLTKLGLPKRVIITLINFRNKGGRFRKKADLAKIYGLSEEMFTHLEPFITLEEPVSEQKTAAAYPTQIPKNKEITLDINQATEEAWQQLKGIGPAYAKRIVNYREKLGGFTSVEQVAETRFLPDSVFQKVRSFLIPSPVFRKIQINTASQEQLNAHPYLSEKQAAVLVNYRIHHGNYTAASDVENTKIFEASQLQRLIPYLDFSEK